MQRVIIGIATITAALAADMQAASAQNESFFQERYCTRSMGSFRFGGNLDCSYRTWQQCIETGRGLNRYCTENPFWHGSSQKPTVASTSRPARVKNTGPIGPLLNASAKPATAPDFVTRTLQMLQSIGWIAAHRFLFAELRAHLLGWPAFLNPDGRVTALRPAAPPA